MAFTFYGDLLGISNAYKLSPKAAYQKLNSFYNLCFQHLKNPRVRKPSSACFLIAYYFGEILRD